MKNKELQEKRDAALKKRFGELCKKHPQWRLDAIIKMLSEEFFLSENTIRIYLKRA